MLQFRYLHAHLITIIVFHGMRSQELVCHSFKKVGKFFNVYVISTNQLSFGVKDNHEISAINLYVLLPNIET